MTPPAIDLTFPHAWAAEILAGRPAILPTRHFTYPAQVEEVERDALEIMVRPENAPPFLATCAVGFRDPAVPTGIWSAPNPHELCAVSGGYAYLIDTAAPERFAMLPGRPVLQVLPAKDANLLLFVDHRSILGWGAQGEVWQSPKLSDEGVTVTAIEPQILLGLGWNMITDKESAFTLDLQSGLLIAS